MIPRLLAVWRDRANRTGFLWRHLRAALREPKEPPRGVWLFGHGVEDAVFVGPDADPAAPTVLLPAVSDQDPGNRPPTDVPHEGATEAFGDLLAAMKADLAHGGDGIDPESLAWDQEFAALDRRLADVHMAFVRRWATVERMAERVAPGWRREPAVPVADFAEAMALATGEIPVTA